MGGVVQEARAARSLVRAGDAGLAVLREHVLIELPAADLVGNPVCGVRPSWVNTVRLALSMAPASWWEAVAAFDPVLAARCTPPDAPADRRHAAGRLLWQTNADRRVWIGGGGGLRDNDAAVIVRLVRTDIDPAFQQELVGSLNDSEPTRRGNALQILTGVLPDGELTSAVREALSDQDPVVRRMASSAAVDRKITSLAAELAERGATDDDQLARGYFARSIVAPDSRS